MAASIRALTAALAVAAVLALVPAMAPAAIASPAIGYDLDGMSPTPAGLGQLDLYLPDGTAASDRLPVVVYVHGGGWRRGDKANAIGRKVALFTGAGYAFASVNYRLSPDPIDPSFPADRIRFPDHPDDIGEAIGWLDRNVATYGGDPSRILLIGHSAGAHLVSLISTDPRYVTRWGVDRRHMVGTVSLDTDAYDVAAKATTGSAAGKALFFNAFATPAENAVDSTWATASPIAFADGKDPGFLLVTQQGSPRRVAGAERMADALGSGSSVLAVPYDHNGINDAIGSSEDPADETPAIMSFFDRRLALTRTSKVRVEKRPKRRVNLARDRRRARIRFRFVAKSTATAFECRRDRAPYRRCASPVIYRAGVGRHRFRVRAIAANGKRGPIRIVRFRVFRHYSAPASPGRSSSMSDHSETIAQTPSRSRNPIWPSRAASTARIAEPTRLSTR